MKSSFFLVAVALAPRQSTTLNAWSRQSSQIYRANLHSHTRLFGVPNSDVNANQKLVPNQSKKQKSGKSVLGKAPEAKVLKPHAPKTPRPLKEDEYVLEYANQLLDTQAATKSPTRRIAEADFLLLPAKQCLEALDEDMLVGPKPYATSMELLRDSKRRAQKLLSRSNFEKQKAEEKKRRIMARMEEELKQVENRLQEKLRMTLEGIESAVERMQILINREMILEDERMTQFNMLVQNLQSSSLAIREDIATETKIIHEMKALRSKLHSDSSSAVQLDMLIVRKHELLCIESELLNDLKLYAHESKKAFTACEVRYKLMQSVLDTVCRPVNTSDNNYDWSDIDKMETVLTEATEDVEQSEVLLTTLRKRIEFALMRKDAISMESALMQRSQTKGRDIGRNSSISLKKSDLQGKNNTDVMKQLAVSLTNATLSGSKATAFALKTFIDAVSAEEFSVAADLARAKASQITFASNETFKETVRVALDSLVDTTKVFFEAAAVSSASREAEANAQNVTHELISAVNAVSVLGNRAYSKLMNGND